MPIYRFYSIKQDGHIAGPAAQHDLTDDAAAMAKGMTLLDGLDIEIWLGTRVVGYLKAQHAAAAQHAAEAAQEAAQEPADAPVISRS